MFFDVWASKPSGEVGMTAIERTHDVRPKRGRGLLQPAVATLVCLSMLGACGSKVPSDDDTELQARVSELGSAEPVSSPPDSTVEQSSNSGGPKSNGSDGGVGARGTDVVVPSEFAVYPSGDSRKAPADGNVLGYTDAIERTIADLNDFWSSEYPRIYGVAWKPLSGGEHPYSSDTPPPSCGGESSTYQDAADNAFYCPDDDFLAWDDQSLMPKLYQELGSFTVSLVLAHEWGHAVQGRAGFPRASVVAELQADCFAGAWMHEVVNGSRKYLVADESQLNRALPGMLRFRDEPGSDARAGDAHGSAFDRISAFQDGLSQGASRCSTFATDPPEIVEIPFTSQEDFQNNGNLPFSEIVDLAQQDLNSFWVDKQAALSSAITDLRPYQVSDASSLPACAGTKAKTSDYENNFFFCPDESGGFVAFDQDYFQHLASDVGDFAVATLLGGLWSTSVQLAKGQISGGETAESVAQADCLTGAWAGHLARGDSTTLQLSPGDLDEAVGAFLEVGSARLLEPFVRTENFRSGFFGGVQACKLS